MGTYLCPVLKVSNSVSKNKKINIFVPANKLDHLQLPCPNCCTGV
jgi:hypothetical protein